MDRMEYLASILDSESAIRLGCFFGVLLLVALGEMVVPRRHRQRGTPVRWMNNFGLVFLNTFVLTFVLRFALPAGAVGVAVWAEGRGLGLLNHLAVSKWLAVPLSVIALDLVIYLQHVVFHAFPLLWQLHMVHHADLDFDVSTGLRFHTIEILLSMGIKAAAIILLGVPAVAVLVFEVLLNATSMFNHGNLRLPPWLDRVLRLFVVTPDMHRVHHSVIARETNSNFGFNLPWWDFLFGTYRSQPAEGHEAMTIGLHQFRDRRVQHLHQMLALPFIGQVGDYPVNGDRHDETAVPSTGSSRLVTSGTGGKRT
jgi:sterol desaturase/sphingolipid hydroxylase (fatty acid hydroxylase superfamily)